MPQSGFFSFPEDTVILKEGDVRHDMFKIVKGHAEVYVNYGTDRESLIGLIGPQSCFGEFGLLLGKPSIITVVAYSDVLVLRISEADLDDFINRNHRNIIDIMKNMANTMLTMKFQIEMLLSELEAGKASESIDLREKKLLAKRMLRAYALHTGSPL